METLKKKNNKKHPKQKYISYLRKTTAKKSLLVIVNDQLLKAEIKQFKMFY